MFLMNFLIFYFRSLVRLQRKIYQANLALHHFILNNWLFENQNFINLSNDLKLTDLKAFYFNEFLEFDLILYFRYAVLGARRYLLGEKDVGLPQARKKYQRMKFLDYFVKSLLYGFVFYVIFVKHDFLMVCSSFCKLIGCYKC